MGLAYLWAGGRNGGASFYLLFILIFSPMFEFFNTPTKTAALRIRAAFDISAAAWFAGCLVCAVTASTFGARGLAVHFAALSLAFPLIHAAGFLVASIVESIQK